MRDALQKNGTKCVLTRETDDNPDFKKRAEICAKAKPDFIVSIHFNASTDHKALGTVAMVGNPDRNPNFVADMKFASALSAAISKVVQEYVPGSKARSPINDSHLHNGMGSNFFKQLAAFPDLSSTPKCFLEVEFIDNDAAERGLIANRSKSFPKIANAFAEFIAGSEEN
jgi:N-acetylmuramoyl-L-alanine amidase